MGDHAKSSFMYGVHVEAKIDRALVASGAEGRYDLRLTYYGNFEVELAPAATPCECLDIDTGTNAREWTDSPVRIPVTGQAPEPLEYQLTVRRNAVEQAATTCAVRGGCGMVVKSENHPGVFVTVHTRVKP